MATFEDKLDGSLARLNRVTRTGRRVFAARELGRVHRDRLIAAGYLQRIIGGWMLRVPPDLDPADGTHWWAAYWSFCAAYCESRFGEVWHLSAEQSVLLHTEDTVVPSTLVVCARKGQNNHLELLHGTALYDLREASSPPAEDLVLRDGLRLYTLDAALVRVPEAFYTAHPLEAQLALRAVPDASGLLRRLLRTGQPIVAGRLAGAFRHIGRVDLCEEVIATMRAARHAPVEKNPFAAPRLPTVHRRGGSSIAGRLAGLVALGRNSLAHLPIPAAGKVEAPNVILEELAARHAEDAFHGLWLDGQVITREALDAAAKERPSRRGDVRDVSALIARGDLMAFRAVTRAIGTVLAGAPVVEVLREAHREWYREWMKPRVNAGLLPAAALAGYREETLYLPDSRFVPPAAPLMRVAMPVLFDLLEAEPEPFVRAVLTRWLITYLSPYRDGNERMAQFLMNAFLATAGFQWRTLQGTEQARYADALQRANLSYDLTPLATLISEGLGAVPRATDPPADPVVAQIAEPARAAKPVPPPPPAAVASEAVAADRDEPDAPPNGAILPLVTDGVAPKPAPPAAVAPAAPPAGEAKGKRRKTRYAPQPTQMGLFGE